MGSEFFTGNLLSFTYGLFSRKLSYLGTLKVIGISLVGNYAGLFGTLRWMYLLVAGTVLCALALWGMGTFEPSAHIISDHVAAKVNTNFGVNLLKAIPGGMLVCVGASSSLSHCL